MHSIRFETDQNALIYIYEAEDYLYLDLMRARLGVSWDSEDHLIKHSLETLPTDLESLIDSTSGRKGFDYRLKKVFFFFFCQDDLIEDLSTPEKTLVFKFAGVEIVGNDEYYHIPGRILDIPQDVYLTTEVPINRNVFKLLLPDTSTTPPFLETFLTYWTRIFERSSSAGSMRTAFLLKLLMS